MAQQGHVKSAHLPANSTLPVSTAASQLRFAAEFAMFLAAGAGLSLVALRPGLMAAGPRARWCAATGFLCLGAGAFLHGSLLVDDSGSFLLVALRVGAVALLGLAASWWIDRGPRALLAGGLALLVLAGLLGGLGQHDGPARAVAADWAQLAASAAVGAALYRASRRSVAARVAASAAATLLLVVLGLSVALSAVISSNVEDEAVRRNDARADTVSQLVLKEQDSAIKSARLLWANLKGSDRFRPLLEALARNPQDSPDVRAALEQLNSVLYTNGPLMYLTVTPEGAPGRVVARVGVDPEHAVALAGARVVGEALVSNAESPRGSLQVVGDLVLSVGVAPVFLPAPTGGARLVGAVVATTSIDRAWLEQRAPEENIALVARGRVADHTGSLARGVVLRAGRRALTTGARATATDGVTYASASPVMLADQSPELAVVTSSPAAAAAKVRESLFRTIFLVAMVASLLALVLASILGERIGAGLRLLTGAARGIQEGDLSVRAHVSSDDEVGVLGAAFDTMATSIESLAQDLREAADDEARLRNRVEAIVAGMGEALVALDVDGRITTFNQAAEALTGARALEVVGAAAADVLRLLTPDGDSLASRLTRPGAETWGGPAELVRDDGERLPVAVSAGALRGAAGELAGGVLVLRDMRREREIERMKTEFLSNISHELRTPLTPIKGYAEILKARPVPAEKQASFLDGILEASDRLERVIDLLVSYAAVEAGRLNVHPEPLKVREVLDRAIARWARRAGEAHPVSRRVARDVPGVVADRRLLDRTIDELIDNAIKYSPAGGRITLGATIAADAAEPSIVISVTDRGVGIPPDHLEAVFGDFRQVDGSATRQYGGLGLGLAYVNRIVRAHRGTLACVSTPGRGSTFKVTLPVRGPAPDAEGDA